MGNKQTSEIDVELKQATELFLEVSRDGVKTMREEYSSPQDAMGAVRAHISHKIINPKIDEIKLNYLVDNKWKQHTIRY